MEISILSLVKDLAKSFADSCYVGDPLNGRIPCLGKKSRTFNDLVSYFRERIYDGLLKCQNAEDSSVAEARSSEYEQLYAICYQRTVADRHVEAERLDQLADSLKSLEDQIPELKSVLVLLLSLTDSDVSAVRADSSCFSSRKRRPADFRCSKSIKPCQRYECFFDEMFESIEMRMSPKKSEFSYFDFKTFTMIPGLNPNSSELKCNWTAPRRSYEKGSDPWIPAIDGCAALTGTGSSDTYCLDVRLELPELCDESTTSSSPPNSATKFLQLTHKVKNMRIGLVTERQRDDPLAEDDDEGFVETNTPSSAASFGRLPDDSVWNIALSNEELKKPLSPYRTWESLGCHTRRLEKPLLTEAGIKATDHLASLTIRQELSVLCSAEGTASEHTSFRCTPYEILCNSLYAMLGLPSKVFSLNENLQSFKPNNVTVSGLTQDSLHNLLNEFAKSGTDTRRLENFISSTIGNAIGPGVVLQSFADGIRRFLYHRQAVLSLLLSKIEGQRGTALRLIHLVVKTAELRHQTWYLSQLCSLIQNQDTSVYSGGVKLLRHLFDATVVYSSCDREMYPIMLALLSRTAEPYFKFLQVWAFQGICHDVYGEFPIQLNRDCIQSLDATFWSHGFVLSDEVDDPFLGPLLQRVFLCGKSLYLLQLCRPQHPLCVQRYKSPVLGLAYLKKDLDDVEKTRLQYIADVEKDLEKSRSLWLQKQQETERKREELIQRAKIAAQQKLDMLKEEKRKWREIQWNKKRLAYMEIQAQITEKQQRTEDSGNENPTEIIVGAETATTEQDSNANLIDFSESTDVNANTTEAVINATNLTDLDENEPKCRTPKGTKRKQDRESIDFEVLAARRSPKIDCNTDDSGLLVEGRTLQILRTRGRSAYGHASDSTIQKLMYGSGYGSMEIEAAPTTKATQSSMDSSAHLADDPLDPLNVPLSKRFEYTKEFPQLDQSPISDVANWPSIRDKKNSIDKESLKGLVLPVVVEKCVVLPLCAQASLVDRSLLYCFLLDLKVEEHFQFVQDYFFMQDGEFTQCLCDLIFDRLAKSTKPTDFFNPLVLNSVLAKTIAYSAKSLVAATNSPNAESPASDRRADLTFVVNFVPPFLNHEAPNVLDGLRLTYRVDWPVNIILSPEVSRYYERIYTFLLQIRRCLWAITDMFLILKASDPTHSVKFSAQSADVKRYRLLQHFRQEMHHFVRSLQEHLNLQVFQVTYWKFKKDIQNVKSFDELIAVHKAYLKRVYFRCLLDARALPLMKRLQEVFATILKFRSRLQLLTERGGTIWPEQAFAELQSSYDAFKDRSTLLYDVMRKLVDRGYHSHLKELLMRLDYNHYYTTSCTVGFTESHQNQF